MGMYIIISLCLVTLLAYFFDLSSRKTRIPGVILLMILGIGMRLITKFFHVDIPNLRGVLPVVGTLGLILIVLEGSLDLELTKEKLSLIRSTLVSAVIQLVMFSAAFTFVFFRLGESIVLSVINAIPLGIISSAIAISSVQHLDQSKKEFVLYESSFSDIAGILLFNYFTLNEHYDAGSVAGFIFEIIIALLISAAASFGLALLIHRITHHVKFVPIIAILILLYAIAEVFHLPSLILVLIFGLFLNNIRLLYSVSFTIPHVHKIIHPQSVEKELIPFRHLIGEMTFVVRSFFFIMFGYYTRLSMLFNLSNLTLALAMSGCILLIRWFYFKAARIPSDPVVFVAPRGLITILLLLSLAENQRISFINEGVLSQVIFISSFIMMFGLIRYPPQEKISS
jgi:potassium/hydrogen antiporter